MAVSTWIKSCCCQVPGVVGDNKILKNINVYIFASEESWVGECHMRLIKHVDLCDKFWI